MNRFALSFAVLLLPLFLFCFISQATGTHPTRHTYLVIRSFPHDPEAFTQGLCIAGGVLYEGTGLWDRSSVRRVDLSTGRIQLLAPLPPQLFGEGIAVLGERLFQLTWVSRIGFIYSVPDLRKVGTFSYPTEGWGITENGQSLIMSDGTDTIYFLDPNGIVEQKRIQVADIHGPVRLINELEYIHGSIFANVWQSNRIAVIDPASGQVTAWIDLEGLYTEQTGEPQPEALNGIAFDEAHESLYVTGKMWKRIFEIKVTPELKPLGTGHRIKR